MYLVGVCGNHQTSQVQLIVTEVKYWRDPFCKDLGVLKDTADNTQIPRLLAQPHCRGRTPAAPALPSSPKNRRTTLEKGHPAGPSHSSQSGRRPPVKKVKWRCQLRPARFGSPRSICPRARHHSPPRPTTRASACLHVQGMLAKPPCPCRPVQFSKLLKLLRTPFKPLCPLHVLPRCLAFSIELVEIMDS